MNEKVCVLHSGEYSSDKILLFTEKTLDKCTQSQLVYKTRPENELANIILPEKPSSFQGYHAKCYKRYTATSVKDRSTALEKLSQASVAEECSNQPGL